VLLSPFPPQISFQAVAAEAGDLAWWEAQLLPDERRVLSASAVAARRLSFAMGRVAARRALVALGQFERFALVQGRRGEAIWPAAVVGAITHSADVALAATAWRIDAAGVGLDIEPLARRVRSGVKKHIADGDEQSWIMQGPGGCWPEIEVAQREQDARLKMLFCAKEAVFKAFYPLAQVHLDFLDAKLRWIAELNRFDGTLGCAAGPAYPPGYGFQVNCCVAGGYVLASILLPPETQAQ
jgi:4'-phosphopantetheinyl transferase EntD